MSVAGLEELVERAQPAGHDDERARILHQHHFSDEEVVELDAPVDIRIGALLVREDDVQAIAPAPDSWAPRFAASMMPGPRL